MRLALERWCEVFCYTVHARDVLAALAEMDRLVERVVELEGEAPTVCDHYWDMRILPHSRRVFEACAKCGAVRPDHRPCNLHDGNKP